MSAAISAFHWQGEPSSFATDPKFAHKNQGSAGMPAKDHPLRNSKATPEARKVGSKSRAPTANISGRTS